MECRPQYDDTKLDWDGNELLLSDILGTDDDVISRRMEDEVEIKLLGKAINKLSPREQMIIKLRFGLNNAEGKEKTQKERKIMDKEHRVSVYDMVKELNLKEVTPEIKVA